MTGTPATECPAIRAGWWLAITPPNERACRLRSLRMAVRLLAGPAGASTDAALLRAESDPDAIRDAVVAFDRLPPLTMRRVLATFASLHRPEGRS